MTLTKRLTIGLLGAIALTAATALTAAEAKELRILTWQGYADDDWVAEFSKANDVQVKVVYAQTDDEIWSKIKGSDGADFDLMSVNTSELQRYVDAGLVQPHDMAKLPNQKGTLPQFNDLTKVGGVGRDGKIYGIPFAFDSIGLIYDTNKVSPAPDSINILWDPKYKGKILAYDASAHNFSYGALAAGIDHPFKLSADDFGKVKQKLIDVQKNILSYYQSADEALKIYQTNDVALIFANFGHQQLTGMLKANAPVKYVVPKEGALAWLDTWNITKGCKDKDLAEAWVNFVIQKKISQALTDRNGFGNTVTPLTGDDPNQKLVWLLPVEDFQKRSDLWNEVKAAAQQ